MTSAESMVDKIIRDVQDKYRSFTQPDYGFVSTVHEANVYKAIIQQLENDFEVTDYTDVNDDVSFVYHLKNRENALELRLSMVGLYAILCENDSDNFIRLVDSNHAKADWQKIFSLLERSGFVFLGEDLLKTKIPFKLLNAEGEFATVYSLLFSDDEMV